MKAEDRKLSTERQRIGVMGSRKTTVVQSLSVANPMIRILLAAFLIPVLSLSLAAEEPAEPSELSTLREGWQRATRQATEPLNRKYRDALNAMKLRFTQAGRLDEALAVEREIQALEKAASGEEKLPRKLTILSAIYRRQGSRGGVDTTRILRGALERGDTRIVLNTRFGAEGEDPAPSALKETAIVYSLRGERKEKVFPESHELVFEEDLD